MPKAVQLIRSGDPLGIELREVPPRVPNHGEVAVRLRTAALNRRDWWTIVRPSAAALPVTLGSDGAGIVVAIGPGVGSAIRPGDEVVINPSLSWGESEEAPGTEWQILGVPSDGTFAEQVVVPAANVLPRPQRLSWEESAALNLAGLTAWRAVSTAAKVQPGTALLVTGAGSGASTFLVQIAAAHGARVFVTSSAAWKIERAVALGAAGGVDYTDAEWPEKAVALNGEPFDVVIDSAGPPAWPGALRALRRGGRLVNFGATGGPEATVTVRELYYEWRSIIGTTMGSPREYAALLDHVGAAAWSPVVDSTFDLADYGVAFDRLNSAERFGKVVLRIVS